jgi:cell division protease FtsH
MRDVRHVMARVGTTAGRLQRGAQEGLRRWRRSRVAKRKPRNVKVYALVLSLIAIAGLFVAGLAYLAPKPYGRALTINQLGAVAANQRLVSATFRDEDAQIVGEFLCPVASESGPAVTAATSPGLFSGPSTALPTCQQGRGQPVVTLPASPSVAPSAAPSSTGSKPAKSPTAAPGAKPAATPAVYVLTRYSVAYPHSDSATAALLETTASSGARVAVLPQTRKSEIRIVTTLVLPLMLLANLFVLLFAGGKGGGAGIGEVEMFSAIGKGRFSRKRKTPTTFADVAGADEALAELREVRDYIANPARYKEIGASPPKGVLLIGPPGCGKTLIAKAVAGEVGVPFFSVAAAEFVESLVGVGAARVRDLFARVRSVAPAVVFIDELDAAGRKRASGGASGGNEERESTLNQLLVEMDGFDVSSGIVVMAATNRPDILDPALLRPGRFDRHVTVDRPDVLGRVRILELHARGKLMVPNVDFGYLARRTPGFSGADLANLINEAALLAVRQDKSEIDMSDLEEAIQRCLSGTVQRGRMLSPEERKRAAYHESGHVIAAAAGGQTREIHRVSILTAGRNMGTTSMRGDDDALMLTRDDLTGRLVMHLAGMAAEELIFGNPSTGSEDDVERATSLARDIAARYGMSEALGPVRHLAHDVDAFLDADVPLAMVSGVTHQEIDAEVRRLLDDAKRAGMDLLATHRDTLDALAARLEAEETLEGGDLEEFLVLVRPEAEMFGSLLTGERVPVGAQRDA